MYVLYFPFDQTFHRTTYSGFNYWQELWSMTRILLCSLILCYMQLVMHNFTFQFGADKHMTMHLYPSPLTWHCWFSSSFPCCMFASYFSWNSSGSCFFDGAFTELSIVLWMLNCFAIWWISQGNLQKTFGLSKVFQHSMFNVYNCWLCHFFFFFFQFNFDTEIDREKYLWIIV